MLNFKKWRTAMNTFTKFDDTIIIDSVERYAAVERYPHVLENLYLLWGYPEFLDYVRSITQDTRDEVRRGFPVDVLNELSFLHTLYLDQMNTINRESLTDSQIIDLNEKLNKNDIWNANYYR